MSRLLQNWRVARKIPSLNCVRAERRMCHTNATTQQSKKSSWFLPCEIERTVIYFSFLWFVFYNNPPTTHRSLIGDDFEDELP